MSVVSRQVPSVPVRTSVATWTTIIGLLTPPDASARADLEAVTSTVAMLIAEEYTREAPIVVMPVAGDRVRIYTLHGAAAVEGEDPAALATWPLAEAGWRISLPCGAADLDDVRIALEPHPHFEVRNVTEGIATPNTAKQRGTSGHVLIDYAELERS
ncbi:hypothetical protein FHG89_24435 [Micromonospora orduensis]|uniref:Uncharacterized protein n=1 Tax=Micromonospora orduensis TaxID=1420891 RepID=A0A5C4QJN7_9ACTN|nr:hypothetical protein [Micromonospora orduensis]TNH24731.1 hypothetical protein FHG89_24435 [Micromonospora orduensis]